MGRILKDGAGWRIGWDPSADTFQGLVGTDDWSLELTQAELADFCRLFEQLANTMTQMEAELMDEEAIACEAETELLWLEVQGYPQSYGLHVIVLSGRRAEGRWTADAVPLLLQAVRSLQVF